MKLSWHSVFDHVLQKSSVHTGLSGFVFEFVLEIEAYYVSVQSIILYTIVRLVPKQHKTLNSRAYVCWFSWLKKLHVHIEIRGTKEIKSTWCRRLPQLNRKEKMSKRDAIIQLKVILFCYFVLLHTVASIAAHGRWEREPPAFGGHRLITAN